MLDIYSSKQTTVNISEKSNMIWNNANHLVGLYKPHEYGKVILPMTVIKRFHDTLLPTREKVLVTYEKVKNFEVKDGFLEAASGLSFYNTSPFTFESLLADSSHIEDNFRSYINGFSDNVQDVLAHFDFEKEISKLANNNILFYIIQEFNKKSSYLGADIITAVDMGYIFEDLIKTFSETYNEEAGAHFTSRDIIYLMTDLLICDEKDALVENGVVKTVYDQTMGTSQMLGCMEERLRALDSDAEIRCFGQEFNPETYAIAKADMIIKGGNADNMKFGDTLSDDKFPGYTFDYCISNPPFGIDWRREETAVKAENKLGDKGRFGAGLPKISDGQMLFMLNGISKLKDTGKMAIIQNGASLYGDAESGPSEIKRYVIENDWLDSIVRLNNNQFYNTPIITYIWIINKKKPLHRQGKVQLIDAKECFEKRRKAIGEKKNDITNECREMIVNAYGEFLNKEYSQNGKNVESIIIDNVDFAYNKVIVNVFDEKMDNSSNKKKPRIRETFSVNIPITNDIDTYFEKYILSFNPNSKIDRSKTKTGYEIPFSKYFYKYESPADTELLRGKISLTEHELKESLTQLFSETTLKPIRELKESDISWIGKIPYSWGIKPHRNVMEKKKEVCEEYNGEDILSLTMNGVIVRDLENPSGKMPATFDGYQKVDAGNLLMCLFDIDVTPRCIGLIRNEGLTSPAYSQFVLKDGNNAEYYNYLLRMIDDKKCFLHLSKNLRSSLTETDFGAIQTIQPDIIEQEKISAFLDEKLNKINEVIEKNKQLIAELEEYKKSLIYESVTGKKEV
ncbi:N-6 DNA methylase [Paenibacillus sp. FSL P4-0081]|uniref:N-6 DNA methylase n=1 Tax=Paenibacillus sp. FSL P4-0081 TaxID=1536769 RepID=UPI0009DFC91D